MAIIENEFKLTDLIDIETLQKIQDAFSDMSGIAALVTDARGRIQTKPSGFTEFCGRYVRNTEEGRKRCEKCDKMGAEKAARAGVSCAYFAMPVWWRSPRPLWPTGIWWGALSADSF